MFYICAETDSEVNDWIQALTFEIQVCSSYSQLNFVLTFHIVLGWTSGLSTPWNAPWWWIWRFEWKRKWFRERQHWQVCLKCAGANSSILNLCFSWFDEELADGIFATVHSESHSTRLVEFTIDEQEGTLRWEKNQVALVWFTSVIYDGSFIYLLGGC